MTRIRFDVGRRARPDVDRVRDDRLRLDLTGVSAGGTPARLKPGTAHVLALERLPPAAHAVLPPGVSERFFVDLATGNASWLVEEDEDGFTLLVGDPEMLGRGTQAPEDPGDGGTYAATGLLEQVLPSSQDLLPTPVRFLAGADQPLRAGPSAVHAQVGHVSEGEARVADARRGGWIHLTSGGWLRHALPRASAVARESSDEAWILSAPRTEGSLQRRPAAWSVVTLGTGLAIDVIEAAPRAGADPEAEAVAALFLPPVQLARFAVRVAAGATYGFRFPAREGRVVFTLKDGTEVETLDPAAIPRRPGVDASRVEEAFAAPRIVSGESWTGWVVLPGDFDFLSVMDARVDVGGRRHRLFLIPGSGELVEQ